MEAGPAPGEQLFSVEGLSELQHATAWLFSILSKPQSFY